MSHASSVISEFMIDTDGDAARETCRGRKFNGQLPEFGERAMSNKSLPTNRGEKLEPRWRSGTYTGINEVSQERIMGATQGAVAANEFERKGSEGER